MPNLVIDSAWRLREYTQEARRCFYHNVGLKRRPKLDSSISLEGQIAIVTGGNKGIGREITRDLSSRGCRVIIACRDIQAANELAQELNQDERGEVVVKKMDLASAESIRLFVAEIIKTEEKIDILVNNAGLLQKKRKEVAFEEGKEPLEIMIAINYFGTCLLSLLMIDILSKSPDARIVFMPSMAYFLVNRVELNDLGLKKGKNGRMHTSMYAHTKLCILSFAKVLARSVDSRGIRVYATDPGISLGGTADSLYGWQHFLMFGYFNQPFIRSPKGSANAPLMSIVMSKKDDYDPNYVLYTNGKKKREFRTLKDDKALSSLWEITKETLSMHQIMNSLNQGVDKPEIKSDLIAVLDSNLTAHL